MNWTPLTSVELKFQGRINEVTRKLIASEDARKQAKSNLVHLAKHFDEYSKERICMELNAIAEEVL